MSVFARKQSFPTDFTDVMASWMVAYWTEESSEDIPSLTDALGKDKWWINLYSPGIFLGTTPRGDTWHFSKGDLKMGCRLWTTQSWLGWVRNNGWSRSLGQLAGNLLCNMGHNLGDYVTRKYRQNILTSGTVSCRSLWPTANLTTSNWVSSGNTCFRGLVNSSGTALSWSTLGPPTGDQRCCLPLCIFRRHPKRKWEWQPVALEVPMQTL